MKRKKKNKILSVFSIFFKSIKIYFMYLDKTVKYMFIPIFGQIFGLILIFLVACLFKSNISNFMKIDFFAQNSENLIFLLFLLILPFLALFLYSFYRYIIAFCSLNVTFYPIVSNKKIKNIDFSMSDKFIERKLFHYTLLLFFVSLLCLFPPLWLVLCLSFQAFSLDSEAGCFRSIGKSIKYTLINIIPIIIMLILVTAFSYWFLPSLFVWALEKTPFVDFITAKLEVYFRVITIPDFLSKYIDSVIISRYLVETLLMSIIIGFTLPFRCDCFSKLYQIIDSEYVKEYSIEDEEIIRRARKSKSS